MFIGSHLCVSYHQRYWRARCEGSMPCHPQTAWNSWLNIVDPTLGHLINILLIHKQRKYHEDHKMFLPAGCLRKAVRKRKLKIQCPKHYIHDEEGHLQFRFLISSGLSCIYFSNLKIFFLTCTLQSILFKSVPFS